MPPPRRVASSSGDFFRSCVWVWLQTPGPSKRSTKMKEHYSSTEVLSLPGEVTFSARLGRFGLLLLMTRRQKRTNTGGLRFGYCIPPSAAFGLTAQVLQFVISHLSCGMTNAWTTSSGNLRVRTVLPVLYCNIYRGRRVYN